MTNFVGLCSFLLLPQLPSESQPEKSGDSSSNLTDFTIKQLLSNSSENALSLKDKQIGKRARSTKTDEKMPNPKKMQANSEIKTDEINTSSGDFNPIDEKVFFTELAEKHTDGELLPYSEASCRFNNIFCPARTRVRVPGEEQIGDYSGDPVYLHANHVNLGNRHFIATQYPKLYEFSDKQLELFWKMSRDSSLIVDLTNKSDHEQGLEMYAPLHCKSEDDSEDEEIISDLEFGNLGVICTDVERIANLKASMFTYTVEENFGDNECSVKRLHFKGWPDHQGLDIQELDRLVDLVIQNQKDPEIPVVIHCRAGVGRTGTLIVACAMKAQIQAGIITPENLKEKMSDFILSGRVQRGKHFVQSPSQLKTLIDWAHLLFKTSK